MNVYLKKFIESNFENPGKALDLGSGDFSDVNYLKKEGWECEGVDKKSGVNLEKLYISNMKLFDLVYSNYVLHFLNNRQQLINSAYKNLKKGGWLFIHAFEKSDKHTKKGLTEKEMREMLQQFKNISIKVFNYYDNEPNHNHWHRVMEVSAQK